MKNIIILSLLLFATISLSAQEYGHETWKFDEEITMNQNFKDISQIISSEFPEAYKDFMEISFIRVGTSTDVGTASFLIPTIKLKNINSAEMTKRIKNMSSV